MSMLLRNLAVFVGGIGVMIAAFSGTLWFLTASSDQTLSSDQSPSKKVNPNESKTCGEATYVHVVEGGGQWS